MKVTKPSHPQAQQGFSLLESLLILAILSVIATWAVNTYQRHIHNARLYEAQSALMFNAQFLERYYAQNARFTRNATTWPKLPVTQTPYFRIAFTGTARGARAGTYRLQATAINTQTEPRYLTIDQNHTLQVCHKQGSKTLCQAR